MRHFKISCSIIMFCIFLLCINFSLIRLDEKNASLVSRTVNEVIDVSGTENLLTFNKIKELQKEYNNTDIKGIVSIDGNSNFNYPIVQSTDNDYYLNHDYYKQYNNYGSIYADYRIDLDNSRKVLIFGHSSVKRDVPFNSLENYYSEDYYKEHKYITLETETNTYRYEIFSVYVETSDFTYMNIKFDNDKAWYLHIKALQNRSLYNTDVVLNGNDDILIMQTCSNNINYQNYSKKYLLIVSRRVK